jgi:hypothetical protein
MTASIPGAAAASPQEGAVLRPTSGFVKPCRTPISTSHDTCPGNR